MVYRNNTSRLGTDFISVSLETRCWVKTVVSTSRNHPVFQTPRIAAIRPRGSELHAMRRVAGTKHSVPPWLHYFLWMVGNLVKIIVCVDRPHLELFRTPRITPSDLGRKSYTWCHRVAGTKRSVVSWLRYFFWMTGKLREDHCVFWQSKCRTLSGTKDRNNQRSGDRVTRVPSCRIDQTLCTTATALLFWNNYEFCWRSLCVLTVHV